jgi:spore coat protein U-like protein
MDKTQITQMYTMLQHKGIIHVVASATFVVVGRTSAFLGVNGHTILEKTVSADSCPLKVLDFGRNKLVTSRKMASSTIITTCPRSSTTYIQV